MKNYFEVKATIRKEEADKNEKISVYIEAMSFTEAEAKSIKYLDKELDSKMTWINAMSRRSYHDFIIPDDYEGDKYHEVNSAVITEDLDSGKEKREVYRYLVACDTVKEADEIVIDYMKDTQGDWKITMIKEKLIDSVVME